VVADDELEELVAERDDAEWLLSDIPLLVDTI
jgi:hypothetical protein